MWKRACISALGFFGSTASVGQQTAPVIKAEVVSTFLWGEDSYSGAVSSLVHDPLTGDAIRKLTYGGIEVSSRFAYERISRDEMGIFVILSATIVNTREANALVRYGGVSVDGHAVLPPAVVPPGKKLSRKALKHNPETIELGKMNCFTGGYLSYQSAFPADPASRPLIVASGTAVTIFSVFRDPRRYQPLQCSTGGCFPTGSVRYYITVNGQDYVFVWPGRSAVNCGK